MRLLLDTDAFCKLAIAGLLSDAAALLGADLPECGRLAALTYMLRRSRLRRTYGPDVCDRLIPLAETLPVMQQAGDAWLDRLTPVDAIDAGEAQIFALAAETGLPAVSDDKRALRALKEVPGFSEALAGRIVVLEALLLALCDHLGPDQVRRRIAPLAALDRMVLACFSEGNPVPREALLSFYRSRVTELDPLILWAPGPGL